ncbi:PCI domain-containing protein [Ditylenchus destructor]|nr:PCI domain-containing protein [Ditylenchus destructor]
MAEYDLTERLAPFFDIHLVIPMLEFISETKMYDENSLFEMHRKLLLQTNMIDSVLEMYEGSQPPEDVLKRRDDVLAEREKLKTKCDPVVEILERDDVKELMENSGPNREGNSKVFEYIEQNYGFTLEMIDVLFKYAKFNYECGNYGAASICLYYYCKVVPASDPNYLNALYGKLGSEILLGNWAHAKDDLTRLRAYIDSDPFENQVELLQHKAWLMHWSLFVHINTDCYDDIIATFLNEQSYLNTIQILCPHLLRYLAAAVVISKNKPKHTMKELIKVIDSERYNYRDPVTDFLSSLYLDFDFDGAQEKLQECEQLLKKDFFLVGCADDFRESARLLVFEMFCRIHQCISLDMLASRLFMKPEEAERWIVDLIRNFRIEGAKMDSDKKMVMMGSKPASIHEQVMENTKRLTQRSQQTALQLEKAKQEKGNKGQWKNESDHMGKKRERRKKCRRKRVHLPKSALDSLKESKWIVPPIHAIQNRSSSAFCRPNQISTLSEGYKAMITIELLSEPGFDALAKVSPRSADELLQIAGRISSKFRKIRMHRIANDHIPEGSEQFLGTKNSTTLVQNLVNVFCDLRSRGDVTTYDELFKKIRLNQIEWLYGSLHEVKAVMMRNILQYIATLFSNFICRIFYTTMNSDGQIVHYKRSVWRRIEKSGFQLLRAQRKFKQVESISDDKPLHRLRFLPKITTGGLRPIVTFKNEKVTQQLSEIRAILDLIMEEKSASLGWGAPKLWSFYSRYRKFLLGRKKRKDDNELYWATADVTNCFTIMDHSFLMKTLSQLIPNDRIFHVIRVSLLNEKLKYRCQKRVAGQSYILAMKRVSNAMKRGEHIANNPVGVQLTGREVLKRIQDFALCTIIKKISTVGAQFGVHLNPNKIVCSFDSDISNLKKLRLNEKITWCGFAFDTKTLSMSVDYERYQKRRPMYNIAKNLHKSEYFNYICHSTKRLLKNRYLCLRMCSQLFPAKHRLELRLKFCRFAYEFYFLHFVRQMNLDLRDRTIRVFFEQLVRWILNCFSHRSLPDAVATEIFKWV